MSAATHSTTPTRGEGVQARLVYGAIYLLLIPAEGLKRFIANVARSADEIKPLYPPLLAEARSNAAIGASYVLMARTMLQSSARQNR